MGGFFESKPATSTYKMGKEQKQIFNYAMPYIQQFAQQGLELPQGNGVAPQNENQLKAMQMALQAAQGGQQQVADNSLGSWMQAISGKFMDPTTNPALQATMDAANRPIWEQLTRTILPNVRGEAVTNGVFGSNRQGIAEGLAAQGATNAAADNNATIATAGYQSGLTALMQAMGLTPTVMNAQTAPAATTAGVGDYQYGYDQTVLDADRSQFMNEQTLPLSVGATLLNLLQSIPGGSNVNQGGGSSPFMSMLGLGSTLLGLV